MNLGKWEIDDFLTFVANTHHPETGQATDADSVPTYRIYEDETGTPILTGSMALLDSANTAGFYSERIQLTAANGFEVGKSYSIYVSATVGTIVGTMSHFFQMGVEGATAAALQTVDDNVDAILVDTGTTLPAEHALLATQASVDVIDGIVDAILVDTGTTLPGEHALLATAANLATVDTVVDAIKVVTDALPDGGALTTLDANVDAILVDTGTTLPAEHALLATAASIAGLNDLSSADIQTVIETNDLDHLAKVAHPSGDPVANTLLDYMMNVDGSQTFDRTTDALEALGAGGGGGPTVQQIVDGVWDEPIASHIAVGSTGRELDQTATVTLVTSSHIATDADIAAVKTVVDAIDLSTGAIYSIVSLIPDSGAMLDLALIKAVTDLIPDAGAMNDLAAILVDTGTTLPSEHSDIIDIVSNLESTYLDPILVDTGTTLPAQITALNDLSSADVQTVIEANDLDHLAKVAHPSGDPVADTLFDLIMNVDGSQTFDRTSDALEALGTGGGMPTVGQIADAVWDEAIAGHVSAGTFGAKNQNLVPSETIGDYKADVSALALAADLATVDTVVDAIKAVTDLLPDGGALTTIDSNIDAVLVDTNELQTDWTDGGRLDLILDAILVDTGTSIPSTLSTILFQQGLTDDAIFNMQGDVDDLLDDITDLTADVADVKTDTESIIAVVGGVPVGAITFVYNVTNQISANPIADADVWVTTDPLGNNAVASGRTDSFGNVTFYLDAGTYYFWTQKSGFNFENPDTEVVS